MDSIKSKRYFVHLDNFLIHEDSSIREALLRISTNQHGLVLTINDAGVVVGLATDGDIRGHLIKNASLDDPISFCANRNFVWADKGTPRELLLKQLDHSVRVIPLLNTDRQLTGLISRDHMPAQSENTIYARARAPVRISFAGGGSDITHYFSGYDGAVINATISLYSHAALRLRQDQKIVIHSLDLKETLYADNLTNALEQNGKFNLILSILRVIHPDFGFELFLNSDFPMKSGLGGSAVISASILGCFNEFRRDKWDQHELAELAFQAERLYLGIAGGWQDQYATVFGGFNFMEFKMDQNIVHPLRIHPIIQLELEESLVLCDTGLTHDSDDIHQNQRQEIQREDICKKIQSNVELTYQIRNYLLRGRLREFGEALHETWKIKQHFSKKISNPILDQIYADALANGALGGKLLGAGGGGFFLFYTPPYCKHSLITHLSARGLRIHTFRFEEKGMQSWTVRE